MKNVYSRYWIRTKLSEIYDDEWDDSWKRKWNRKYNIEHTLSSHSLGRPTNLYFIICFPFWICFHIVNGNWICIFTIFHLFYVDIWIDISIDAIYLAFCCWFQSNTTHTCMEIATQKKKNYENSNCWCSTYLNVLPYVINLLDPSKETSSTEWWFELAAPLIIGFFALYGGSYFVRVVFRLFIPIFPKIFLFFFVHRFPLLIKNNMTNTILFNTLNRERKNSIKRKQTNCKKIERNLTPEKNRKKKKLHFLVWNLFWLVDGNTYFYDWEMWHFNWIYCFISWW